MTHREYRRRWLIYHGRYEKRGIRQLRRSLRSAALKIPFGSLGLLTYENSIKISEQDVLDAYVDLYMLTGLMHGKRVGREINKQLKRFDVGFFDLEFRRNVRNWLLQNNVVPRITSVRKGLIDYLIDFVGKRIEEGKTMDEITRLVKKHILSRNFYRWQIERIVRTETTAAANYGASVAGSTSGVKLVKEWVSSHDGRTRRHGLGDLYDHWEMDRVRVAENDFFTVINRLTGQPDNILFPGDPKGAAANVINCRCTAGLIPQRDANGDLVFT